MKRKELFNRILCTVLVLLLAAGGLAAVTRGARMEPEDPVKAAAEPLKADPMDGGSHALRREEQEHRQAEQETE